MSVQELAEVRTFVSDCVEMAGGLVEPHGAGAAQALLPAELDSAFGHRSLVSLVFDGEALASHPDAQLVTIGTPALDALIGYATTQGTTACGYIRSDRLRKKGFLESVHEEITVSGCRLRHDERDQEARYAAYAVFHFRVSLVSDERRERILVVAVNLWSNRVSPELAAELPHLEVTGKRELLIPDAPAVPVGEGYATTCAWLEGEVARLQEGYQARVLRRLEVDYARTTDYYEGVAAELKLRREREAQDPEHTGALDEKIGATMAEKERKLGEIAEKYRLRTTVRLVAARLLLQPKVFGRFFIDRKQTTRELTLAYDPVLERLELPGCEACLQPTSRLTIGDGRLVCPTCA